MLSTATFSTEGTPTGLLFAGNDSVAVVVSTTILFQVVVSTSDHFTVTSLLTPSSMASANSSFPIDPQHVPVDTRWLTQSLDENSRRHVPRILQLLSQNLVETIEDLRHLEKTEVLCPRWLLCPFCNLGHRIGKASEYRHRLLSNYNVQSITSFTRSHAWIKVRHSPFFVYIFAYFTSRTLLTRHALLSILDPS